MCVSLSRLPTVSLSIDDDPSLHYIKQSFSDSDLESSRQDCCVGEFDRTPRNGDVLRAKLDDLGRSQRKINGNSGESRLRSA